MTASVRLNTNDLEDDLHCLQPEATTASVRLNADGLEDDLGSNHMLGQFLST